MLESPCSLNDSQVHPSAFPATLFTTGNPRPLPVISDALTRILNDARDFFDKVEQLKRAAPLNPADVRDAYGRLNRLRERYIKEREERALDPDEVKALAKAFEEDVFIKAMLNARQISEHVQSAAATGRSSG